MKKSLLALATGSFALGFAEFVMMGILPATATGLRVSVPDAGDFISAYALGVCAGTLFLVFGRRVPPKRLLLGFVALVAVGNAAAACAPSAEALVAARFVSGLPHGAFFGTATIVARELADPGREGQAVSIMVLGQTVANMVGVPGEAELQGKGCGLNAARDATTYEGKSVYVIGGADGAVKEALYLARFARQVSIVCVEDELACIAEFRRKTAATPNIQVVPATRVGALHGADRVEALDLVSLADGRTRTVEDDGCGVFVYAGSEPNTALYAGELRLENGFIPTNERMETSISGVYAAGDIRAKQLRQVATAVSDGAIAAVNAATL